MMKKGILILMTAFIVINVQAQTLWDRMANAFAEKEVIIVVMKEHEKALKKYKSPEDKEFYKTSISNYNTHMKEMAPEYITYFKGVQFKTIAEIAIMSVEDRKNYYYICYNIDGASTGDFFGIIKEGEEDDFLFRSYTELIIPLKKVHYSRIEIRGQDLKNKRKASSLIVSRNLPDVAPNKLSLTFALSSLKCYFDKPEVYPVISSIKEKTLVICRKYLAKKLNEAEIKALYKHNFKIVSHKEFEEIIVSKDEQYCYLMRTPYSSSVKASGGGVTMSSLDYLAEVIDNATGCTLTVIMPAKNTITGGILKKLQKQIK